MPVYGKAEVAVECLANDRWALEVCLEGLSLSLDVPLQALNLSIREGIDEEIESQRQLNARFASAEDFYAYLETLPSAFLSFVEWANASEDDVELFHTTLQRHLFLTPACYGSPLVKTFREHRIWSLWESVLLLRVMRLSQSSGISPFEAPSPFHDSIFGSAFSVPEIAAFIVSWPVRRFTAAPTLGQHRTLAGDLVDCIVDALEKSRLPPKLSRAALQRFGTLRAGITVADFEHRLSIARTALQGLGSLPMAANELGRANLTAVALSLAFMATMKDYGQVKARNERDRVTYGFRLRSIGKDSATFSRSPALLTTFEQTSGQLTASLDWNWDGLERTPDSERHTNQFTVLNNAVQASEFASLDRTYSWFLDTAHTRRNAYDYETSLLLRAWCSEYVSDLVKMARGAFSVDDPRSHSVHGDAVAEHVRHALSADLGSVSFYKRSERRAILLGLSHSLPEQVNPTRTFLSKRLSEIANVPEERRRSMTYRALDSCRPQVCFYFDSESEEAASTDDTILRFPPELKQPVSQNAAPITVYGRPWGVLSVAGLRPFQFSANAAATLSDLADFFSTYIYNHWMLASLDTMNSAATAPKRTRAEKYAVLCHNTCQLLLADAATFWTAHATEENRFDLVAWTGRPDLDGVLRARGIDRSEALNHFCVQAPRGVEVGVATTWPFSFDAKAEGRISGAARAMMSGQPWIQGRIGEEPFAGAWFEKDHTRALKESELQSICIIPVRAGDEIRGFVTLFNRDPEMYALPWRDIMRIISEEIALMIQAIEIQTTLEQSLFAPLRHEVRPTVKSLRERIERWKTLARRLAISDEALFREYFLVQSDIDSYTEDLEERLDGIIEGRRQGRQNVYKDIILQEAGKRAADHDGSAEDLREMFNETAISLQRQTNKKQRFVFRGPRKVPVSIDRTTLREILRNLMINAVKYSVPHDEIIGQVKEMPHALEFSLSNSGATLTPEESSRLFSKGFRGAAARRDVPDGSGLGLYYFRELCRLYDITTEYRPQRFGSEGQTRHVFTMLIPTTKWRGAAR